MEDYQINEPHLTTRSIDPENQETPIHFLPAWITPEHLIYLRNHFDYPVLSERALQLTIEGEVEKPEVFLYEDLLKMPSRTLLAVLECSGNKRAFFRPRVYGEQWSDGAISQGIWKGVALNFLLSLTGIKKSALEVVFEGRDAGSRTDIQGIFPFARSLPIKKALHPDTLIAYELNGEPIPFKHGYPLRLIAPGWYGMAWVKWLKKITVVDHPFTGPFQTIDYNYYPFKENDFGKRPVTTINPNSIIHQPLDRSVLDTGGHEISGIAWTGEGGIATVEISIDNGATWKQAQLQRNSSQTYAWVFWTYYWKASQKGEYLIMARAWDSNGRCQPGVAEWNRKGYGYNGITTTRVKVE